MNKLVKNKFFIFELNLKVISSVSLNQKINIVNDKTRDLKAVEFVDLVDKWFQKSGALFFSPHSWKLFKTKQYKEFLDIFDKMFMCVFDLKLFRSF